MKITKEHIGKWVKIIRPDMKTEPFKVLDVGGSEIWCETKSGEREVCDDGWNFEIVEELKKPSKRIRELISCGGNFEIYNYSEKAQIAAIISYLDELHDQGVLKEEK